MKVGLIYTSTTPELIELVEQEVKKQLGGDVELYSLQDPSVLADVREAGYVTTAPRRPADRHVHEGGRGRRGRHAEPVQQRW